MRSVLICKFFVYVVVDTAGDDSGKYVRSLSMPSTPEAPATPTTPTTPSAMAPRKDNVWRSVFNPGSNLASRRMGSQVFDKPSPNTPTVYDWYVRIIIHQTIFICMFLYKLQHKYVFKHQVSQINCV